jgi:hypothetical protein
MTIVKIIKQAFKVYDKLILKNYILWAELHADGQPITTDNMKY